MAQEFLWAGPDCDLSYVGNDGNVPSLLTGGTGTLAAWVNTAWDGAYPAHISNYYSRLFVLDVGANDYFRVSGYRVGSGDQRISLQQAGAGTAKSVQYAIDGTSWEEDVWHHVVVTWDFTGGSGACILRLYVDGAERGTAVTNGNPLASQPAVFEVGGRAADTYILTGWKGFIENACAWSGVMTAPQVAALYAAGYRKPVVEADGTGTLTFLADYNGSYDAAVHAGTATATITAAAQCARIPDGASAIGKRFELHFGTGTDRARVSGLTSWFRKTADFTQPVDGDHYCYLTTAGNANPLYLRATTGWRRHPSIFTIKLLVEDLAAGEYIRIGPSTGSWWRIYPDRIQNDADATKLCYITADDSYGSNDKFVTLAFINLPSGATTKGYLLVNNAILLDNPSGWYSAPGPWCIDTSATYMPTSTVTVKIESVEVYGPTDYQQSDSLFDDFLQSVVFGGTTLSGKLWRTSGVERTLVLPTKYGSNPVLADGSALVESLCDAAWPLFQVFYRIHQNGAAARMVWCTNNVSGARELIYLDSADGITWTEDAANPIADLLTIQGAWGEWDRGYNFGVRMHPTLRDPDGRLVMPYHCADDTDGSSLGLLIGAADDYSFTAAHKYAENPVVRPQGHGDGLWYNRDMIGTDTVENLFPAADGHDRYLMFARGKTTWATFPYAASKRSLVPFRSTNLIGWKPTANTNHPLPGYGSEAAEDFCFAPQWAADRWLGFSYLQATAGLYSLVSEDAILFEAPHQALIEVFTQPGWESNVHTSYRPRGWVRVGDEWLIFYASAVDATNGGVGLATVRYNGLAYMGLSAGQTSGWFETCAFAKPSAGWGPLLLNADCADGAIAVAVLDPDTRAEVAGYGAGDMDAWTGDHVDQEVTWAGHGLDELAGAAYAFKFTLTRPDAGDDTPKLCSYSSAAPYVPLAGGGVL